MRRSPGGGKVLFAGVRSPPLRGEAEPCTDSLAGRGRGRRVRRFSRRDAVSASALRCRAQAEASHDCGRVGKRPVPERRGHFAWRYADITGVRSPPLRGEGHPSWDGLAGKGRESSERRSSRRDAVSASANTGRTQAEASHDYGRVGKRPVPERRGHFAWRYADIAGVRSPPLHGWAIQAGMALRGKAGDGAKDDFLGGARSPRPQIRAGRKPGHVTVTGSLARAWWPKNATFGLA